MAVLGEFLVRCCSRCCHNTNYFSHLELGALVVQTWTCYFADPVLDPFRTGSRSVSCKHLDRFQTVACKQKPIRFGSERFRSVLILRPLQDGRSLHFSLSWTTYYVFIFIRRQTFKIKHSFAVYHPIFFLCKSLATKKNHAGIFPGKTETKCMVYWLQ